MAHPQLSENPGDIFFYIGEISRYGYSKLTDLLEISYEKSPNCTLSLATFGGDPAAAYRIARALHHYYHDVTIVVSDQCKSAGTLLCVGAHNIVFGDRGEMGPLDIQLSKPDELFESMSGLDLIQAHNSLGQTILENFTDYLVNIRKFGIGTKPAAEISQALASKTIEPILDKINPITMGGQLRAMSIAMDYGMRLNKMSNSLKELSVLKKLVSGYHDHGFVIDRREAREELFNCVSSPTGAYKFIYDFTVEFVKIMTPSVMQGAPIIFDQNNEMFTHYLATSHNDSENNHAGTSDEHAPEPDSKQYPDRVQKSSRMGKRQKYKSEPTSQNDAGNDRSAGIPEPAHE